MRALLWLFLVAPAWAQSSITGDAVACEDGQAMGHPCYGVTLLSRLMPARLDADTVLDMWGWSDSTNSREYALVATNRALAFVDITDPVEPEFLGTLPSVDSTFSGWGDVKVYGDHAFVVVDGAGANGLQVFDLTRLRTPPAVPHVYESTAHYDGFSQAHNVAVNPGTGFAYAVGSNDGACPWGLHMIDIRVPQRPAFAGCFVDVETGDGYTHDVQCVVYRGPDADYAGREICIGANVSGITIADVTDKAQPTRIVHATYPDASYAHQGWLTADQRYLFLNDESDELMRAWLSLPPLPGTRTLIWDLEDLDDPVLLDPPFYGPTGSSDHNLYIRGDTLYMANYASGLRIVDIATPAAPVEVAYFDTYVYSDNAGLFGAWTAYPYFESGTIAITSGDHGLFLVRHEPGDQTSASPEPDLEQRLSLSAPYPNPFRASAAFTAFVDARQPVRIALVDLLGREVEVLHDGMLNAGSHRIQLAGQGHAAGTYLVVARSGVTRTARAVTLLR